MNIHNTVGNGALHHVLYLMGHVWCYGEHLRVRFHNHLATLYHVLPSYLHQMSADQQIRVSGWQWRVGTGGQISRLLGWGVAAEEGCRTAAGAGSRWQHVCMAASANTWLLFVFVVVYVPLYSFLCKQSGMVYTHCGMPSQACVSISNKAQQCQGGAK